MRDRKKYLVSQALYYAIKHIQAQPKGVREDSNMWEMAEIFAEQEAPYRQMIEANTPDFADVMKAAKRPTNLHRVK